METVIILGAVFAAGAIGSGAGYAIQDWRARRRSARRRNARMQQEAALLARPFRQPDCAYPPPPREEWQA